MMPLSARSCTERLPANLTCLAALYCWRASATKGRGMPALVAKWAIRPNCTDS